MRIRRIDNTERHAAFYDGELIGDVGEDGKVTPRTAPDWFPALAREWDGVSLTMDVEVGDLISKPDKTLVFVSPNGFIELRPGWWIVRDGDSFTSMSDPLFRSAYEACPLKTSGSNNE